MDIKKMLSTYRNFAAKTNRRQREGTPLVRIENLEAHVCLNCGHSFEGKYCPVCGKVATAGRFTVKRAISNFLDLWGFGSRPMFRTISELFIRPGYMIRDYLSGRYPNYFPPFKMLMILTVILFALLQIFDIDVVNLYEERVKVELANSEPEKEVVDIFQQINSVRIWLINNPTVNIVLQYIFLILAARIVFRRQGLNLTETLFAHIYIACQMQIVTIFVLLLTQSVSIPTLLPHFIPAWISFPLMVYDYHQLYDSGWLKTIWKTFLSFVLMSVFLATAIMILSFVYGLVYFFITKTP